MEKTIRILCSTLLIMLVASAGCKEKDSAIEDWQPEKAPVTELRVKVSNSPLGARKIAKVQVGVELNDVADTFVSYGEVDYNGGDFTLTLPEVEGRHLVSARRYTPAYSVSDEEAMCSHEVKIYCLDASGRRIGEIECESPDRSRKDIEATLLYADRPLKVEGTTEKHDDGELEKCEYRYDLGKGWNIVLKVKQEPNRKTEIETHVNVARVPEACKWRVDMED